MNIYKINYYIIQIRKKSKTSLLWFVFIYRSFVIMAPLMSMVTDMALEELFSTMAISMKAFISMENDKASEYTCLLFYLNFIRFPCSKNYIEAAKTASIHLFIHLKKIFHFKIFTVTKIFFTSVFFFFWKKTFLIVSPCLNYWNIISCIYSFLNIIFMKFFRKTLFA